MSHKCLTKSITQPTQEHSKKLRTYNDKKTLFVSNLSFDTTEDQLRELFGAMGPLKAVRIIRDKSQKSKGYCYIEYETVEALEKGLELNQKLVHGRKINVARSQPPKAGPGYICMSRALGQASFILIWTRSPQACSTPDEIRHHIDSAHRQETFPCTALFFLLFRCRAHWPQVQRPISCAAWAA